MYMKIRMKMKSVTLGDTHIDKVSEKAERYGVNFSEMLRRIIDENFKADKNDERRKDKKLDFVLGKNQGKA